MKNDKKKEMSSKMYSQHRCGKCNRFGHHHDKCTKFMATLQKFNSDNKGAGKQTGYLTRPGPFNPKTVKLKKDENYEEDVYDESE